MSQQYIVKKYIFDKTAKTITFPSIPDLEIGGIQLITNLTTGTLIYQFNKLTKGGTVLGNVLTLTFDTSSMSNTDNLQILYNPPVGGVYDRMLYLLYQISETLKSPPWISRNVANLTDRIGVHFDTNSNLNAMNTVSSCTAVQNIVNVGSIPANELLFASWDTKYNTGIRNKII